MTRRPRIGVRSLLALALVVAVSVVAGSAAVGQDGEVDTDPLFVLVVVGNGASVGEQLVIAGAGWEPTTLIEAAICGNQGQNEAIDCVSLDDPFLTHADGSMVLNAAVVDPPTACPCIVRARSLDLLTEASTSLEIAPRDEAVQVDGAEVVQTEETAAEPEPPAAVEPEPVVEPAPIVGAPLVVDVVSITGGGWRSWFGLASERSLEIVVRNTTDVDVDQPTLAFLWGRGPDPQNLVEVPVLGRIVAGQTVALVADFTVSAPTFGSYEIYGIVGPVRDTTTFESSFTTWPWALFAMAAALLLLVLVRIARRLRQRRAPVRRPDESPSNDHDLEAVSLEEVLIEELDTRLTAHLDLQAGAPLDAIERALIAQEVSVEIVGAVIARVEFPSEQISNLADVVVSEIMTVLETLPDSDFVGQMAAPGATT
jgi:hypothetical protein